MCPLPPPGSADSRTSGYPVLAIWASRRDVLGINTPRHWHCPSAPVAALVAVGSKLSHL